MNVTYRAPLSIETFTQSRMESGLNERDRLLLRLLQYPFLRTEDIAFAMHEHPSSAYRQVSGAKRAGLVETLQFSIGNTKGNQLAYLTTGGIQRVAALLQVDPSALASHWGVNETGLLRLLPRLPALVPLQAFLEALIAPAPAVFATSAGYSFIRWHWVRDYHHAFQTKGNKRESITVDAAMVFSQKSAEPETETTYHSAFILIDAGLYGNNDITLMKGRIEALLRFRESQERWKTYSSFPPLLIPCPSERQQQCWQQSARDVATQLRLHPLQGATVSVPLPALLTCQSAWSLPWHDLQTGKGIRLSILFQPMSRMAILPGMLAPRPMPEILLPEERDKPSSKNKTLVHGQFSERARSLVERLKQDEFQTAPLTTSWAEERDMTALLSIALPHRQLEILHMLYAHPCLSVEELATFLDLRSLTVQRYLYELRYYRCIETVTTPRGRRYYATEAGLRLIAQSLRIALTHMCEIRRTDEEKKEPRLQRGLRYQLQTIQHTAGIYSFLARLTQQSRAHHMDELLWWETGARCARRYFADHTWHNLLPDALLAYKAGDEVTHFWLEWDEGTMSPRNLAAKLHAYRFFVESRQWAKEYLRLPILLIVVPHKRQELRISRLVRGILGKTALIVRTTTATRLAHHGPLASIWLPVLPMTDTDIVELERQSWHEFRSTPQSIQLAHG